MTLIIQPGLPTSANSLSAIDNGQRADPEGAPASATVRMTWRDTQDRDRSVILGAYLYQYDLTISDNQSLIARSASDDTDGHPGFGYVVSHNKSNTSSPLGKFNISEAIQTTVFAGAHHAIHRVDLTYDRDLEGGNSGIKIPVTIQWLIATGRDHPVWSVIWRMSAAVNPNAIDFVDDPNADTPDYMDVRGPYGSLSFDRGVDGTHGDSIGGVAWGDGGLRFTTLTSPLTLQSDWSYSRANTVNFVQAWTASTNAEMGIVQSRCGDWTMGYPDRVAASERGHESSGNFPSKGQCGNPVDYLMPCIWGWPYQMMNYDWDGTGKPFDEPTSTPLIAWGSPYGWLGAASFVAMDGSVADGRGDRSYAMFIVLGAHYRFDKLSGQADTEQGDVSACIRAVEALNLARIDAAMVGKVVNHVPRGPGSAEFMSIDNGYDDIYVVFRLSADQSSVAFTFIPSPDNQVTRPIFVIENFSRGRRLRSV